MKSIMKLIRAIVFLLLITISFCFTSTIAYSLEASDGIDIASYGLDITLHYNESETTSHSLDSYQKNSFLLQDNLTNRFILATYSVPDGCYLVTGHTENEANATLFLCGVCPDNPDNLTIKGLDTGSYTLKHIGTEKGFLLLKDVSIVISEEDATIEGNPVEMSSSNNITFGVFLSPEYEIPSISFWRRIGNIRIEYFFAFLTLLIGIGGIAYGVHQIIVHKKS